MPYARSKAARLREFRRLNREIKAADSRLRDLIERRNALLLDNERAPDRATSIEIGAASGEGFGAAATRNTLRKLRERQ